MNSVHRRAIRRGSCGDQATQSPQVVGCLFNMVNAAMARAMLTPASSVAQPVIN